MKYLLCLLIWGCVEAPERATFAPSRQMWICHNPDSGLHGKPCSDLCLETGNDYKYCWLLKEEDCVGDLGLQWQRDNCHPEYFQQ